MENVVQDSYELMIYGLEPDAYVKSMRAGAVDLLDKDLVVGSDAIKIAVEIAANGGRIEGDVSGPGGAPIGGAQVVLIPASGRNLLLLSKQVLAGEDGRFQMRGIAPGTYEMYSWGQIENGRWWDSEYLGTLKNLARIVRVEAGATANMKLAIIE